MKKETLSDFENKYPEFKKLAGKSLAYKIAFAGAAAKLWEECELGAEVGLLFDFPRTVRKAKRICGQMKKMNVSDEAGKSAFIKLGEQFSNEVECAYKILEAGISDRKKAQNENPDDFPATNRDRYLEYVRLVSTEQI